MSLAANKLDQSAECTRRSFGQGLTAVNFFDVVRNSAYRNADMAISRPDIAKTSRTFDFRCFQGRGQILHHDYSEAWQYSARVSRHGNMLK
jgi:hypothetical protein